MSPDATSRAHSNVHLVAVCINGLKCDKQSCPFAIQSFGDNGLSDLVQPWA